MSLSGRGSGPRFETRGSSSKTAQPARRLLTPDRFIPLENGSEAQAERFRTTKLPTALTPVERLLRREWVVDQDCPFSGHGGRGSLFRNTSYFGNLYPNSLNFRWNDTILDRQRRSSVENPTPIAKQDVFDTQRQMDLYQGRVAEALNIDRTLKIIQLGQPSLTYIPRPLASNLFPREQRQISGTELKRYAMH
ncbi:hypothetical protein VHEMI01433 [[Torrubiella] hemipterigena]|uniref:Uncharacterized protein n=1 Tax=[Torrubiella] hemipterigena TaxID=1531966 RepID=A0A0A1T4R9_9HYPO|nr:hypothetical protein VHEMI01433 [[Torrubiella] hemipterigena]